MSVEVLEAPSPVETNEVSLVTYTVAGEIANIMAEAIALEGTSAGDTLSETWNRGRAMASLIERKVAKHGNAAYAQILVAALVKAEAEFEYRIQEGMDTCDVERQIFTLRPLVALVGNDPTKPDAAFGKSSEVKWNTRSAKGVFEARPDGLRPDDRSVAQVLAVVKAAAVKAGPWELIAEGFDATCARMGKEDLTAPDAAEYAKALSAYQAAGKILRTWNPNSDPK